MKKNTVTLLVSEIFSRDKKTSILIELPIESRTWISQEILFPCALPYAYKNRPFNSEIKPPEVQVF